MDTKTCEKCGWALPIQSPVVYCPICHTRFKYGICSKCGEYVEYYRQDRRVCKHCYDTISRTPRASHAMNLRRAAMFDEWKARIKRIPKSYPTLTNEQWLDAVRYFEGCAICGSESIDTRGYFIPFMDGGRYCDWNIIPICEKCSITAKRVPGYFYRNKRPDDIMKVIDYLEEKIDAALKENAGAR